VLADLLKISALQHYNDANLLCVESVIVCFIYIPIVKIVFGISLRSAVATNACSVTRSLKSSNVESGLLLGWVTARDD